MIKETRLLMCLMPLAFVASCMTSTDLPGILLGGFYGVDFNYDRDDWPNPKVDDTGYFEMNLEAFHTPHESDAVAYDVYVIEFDISGEVFIGLSEGDKIYFSKSTNHQRCGVLDQFYDITLVPHLDGVRFTGSIRHKVAVCSPECSCTEFWYELFLNGRQVEP